jgi:hypothetical protein
MGNAQSIPRINFEDIQYSIKNRETTVIINTLSNTIQDCLIKNTIPSYQEEELINNLIKTGRKDIKIIIYGKNSNDDTVYKKYQQLVQLGFYQVFIYTGGLFEWMLLQDIYGADDFPTTKKELDILKYKGNKVFGIGLITQY